MNKKELLDLVGKGYITIGDAQIEVTITQVGGSDYLQVTQKAINECTKDHEFSGGWVEYLKDEDVNELELAILTIHKKMLEQSAICKKEPLVLTTIKGTNKLISNTKKEYLMETFRDHFEIYYCPYSEPEYSINRPLLIDGKLFLPLWSWWLEKGCYIIKETKSLNIKPQAGDILLNWNKNKKSPKNDLANSKENKLKVLKMNIKLEDIDISKLSKSELIGLYLLHEISLEKLEEITNIADIEIGKLMLLTCK